MAEQTDFFVSYTQADRRWAEWIAWQLESAGFRVVILAWDFAIGSNFVVEMDKAATASARTIAVLSADYLRSAFATAEWTAAFGSDPTGEHRKLFPVRVGDVAPTGLLGQISWIDLVGCDEPTATERLLAGAAGSRGKPLQKPAFPGVTDAGPAERPAFPGALPAIWNVPARNRYFTGREEWLARLRHELTTGQPAVVTQAIAGLGGIGKSQLAIEYAHANAAAYRLVWWIRAETEVARRDDLLALAQRLVGRDLESLSVEGKLAALRSALERSRDWLLIFDNVESPDDIRDLIPQGGAGHVLVTSRYSAWGRVANVLSLGVWDPGEATRYLLARTKQADEASAAALAEMLGYLPLAIEQAAAYMDESRITLEDYADLFRKSRGRLLGAAGSKATVATVWSLSLRSVRQQSPHAVTLLQLAAFLPPDNFPRDRLRRRTSGLPARLTEIIGDELALNEAIAVLRRFSLIEATPDHISVHRLVQAVVQEALSESERGLFAVAAHQIQYGTDETSSDGGVEPRVAKPWRDLLVRADKLIVLMVVLVATLSTGFEIFRQKSPSPPPAATQPGAGTAGDTAAPAAAVAAESAAALVSQGGGYGVLRGRVDRWKREEIDAARSHLQIRVLDATGRPWRVTVNLTSGDHVNSYVIFHLTDPLLNHPILAGLPTLGPGFTDLDGKPRSAANALDYSRAPLFDLTAGIVLLPAEVNSDDDSQDVVIAQLRKLKASNGELFVFGSSFHYYRVHDGIDTEFDTKDGVYNVNMNQGNTTEEMFRINGVFEDGGLILQYPDHASGLFFRFQTQVLPTDARGNSIPGVSKKIPASRPALVPPTGS